MKPVKIATCRIAFTLVELLIVIAIIALLLSILLPCLATAKKQCLATVCRSNIRQLYIANTEYALNNDEFYVRGAYDIDVGFGGRHRWHGVRQSDGVSSDPQRNTFDPAKGPLIRFLNDGEIKECPARVRYVKEGALNAFEAGCGGYGYNQAGIGSRSFHYGGNDIRAIRSSMRTCEIEQVASKVMFADTAFAQGIPRSYIIEYSFCEPPYHVTKVGNKLIETLRAVPSIHFRHLGKANVVWCDGHVTAEALDFPSEAKRKPEQFKIGWFGPNDNSLFRPWN
jgi:prepilin-type processing-associated H-X9-DG protein/prepilin-type N-terminal cleavage/methylation domain-containing protein